MKNFADRKPFSDAFQPTKQQDFQLIADFSKPQI
jgi:hypothetical protein